VEWYDRVYDRLTPKQEKPLLRYESRQFFKVTTTDDPVIQ
jgi:translation initiation factor 3 subunit D